MAMARLAKNGALQSPLKQSYTYLSRFYCSISSKSFSTSPIFNQSNSSHSLNQPHNFLITRNYSSGRHFDPFERYVRRTGVNFGIKIVPHQEAYVIERFGKFNKVLEAGLHLLIPFVDRIAYIHSLKEQTFEVPEQAAVTTDNVNIMVNAILFVKVIDAEKASYGNDNAMFAVTQLAQTVMRSAIGKMPLDKTFNERDTLNANIVAAINEIASEWGLHCRRYEIRDIIPPRGIQDSMEKQAEAERNKRAIVIEAEGKKEAVILNSDAARMESIKRAEGEAEAIRATAVAEAEAIRVTAAAEAEAIRVTASGEAEAIHVIGNAVEQQGGQAAASLKLAKDYVQAFNKMAKESTTMLIPSSASDASGMVASALTLYKNIMDTRNKDMTKALPQASFEPNAAPSPKNLTDHPSHNVDNDVIREPSISNEDEDNGQVPAQNPVFTLSKKKE